MPNKKILLIGGGAREHAIAKSLSKSSLSAVLYCLAPTKNPGIDAICSEYIIGSITEPDDIKQFALRIQPDIAVIGPEAPLEAGIANLLLEMGIGVIGPTRNLARIETSKFFARDLLKKNNIPGLPMYRHFRSVIGLPDLLNKLGDNFVIKADGLMGGKGVKVFGEHIHSHAEAVNWCRDLVNEGKSYLIEEKLKGPEFSLMSFCDGNSLAHMPPVQDHKRAYVGDTGPNTGGMGSYSDSNHLLPFLDRADVETAAKINELTALALKSEFGRGYKGILYGGFMKTRGGIKLIEYNARFGDPESMNVLAVLKSDLLKIFCEIVAGTLNPNEVEFHKLATVCKYAVPEGYPGNPLKNQLLDLSSVNSDMLYYAAVDEQAGELIATGSRTAAVVGVAKTLKDAESIAETEILKMKGKLFHRPDIGTEDLINKYKSIA